VPAEALPCRVLWVGLGCQQGTPKSLIEQAIRDVFRACALQEDAIAGLATIDTKVNEAGLIAFCRDRNLPLLFFEATRLRSVAVPHPSSAIDALVGTPSVAEAAAILACWELEGRANRVTGTQRCRKITSADIALPDLCVPKQRFRSENDPGSVTIAVARFPRTAINLDHNSITIRAKLMFDRCRNR